MTNAVEQQERIAPPVGFVGLETRLLLGGEAINPGKTDLPAVTAAQLGNFESRDYTVFNRPSVRERTAYWQGKEDNNFDRQKQAWINNTASLFVNNQTFFTNSEKGRQWSAVFNSLDINTASFNQQSAEALYNKYFTSEASQNPVKTFVADVLAANFSPTDLPAVQWLANIFGENSSQVVRHLIEAEAQLVNQPDVLIQQANQDNRVNNLSPDEQRLLAFLWPNGQSITIAEVTQPLAQQPPAEGEQLPTPSETPPPQTNLWDQIPRPPQPIKIQDRKRVEGKGLKTTLPETHLIVGTREHPLIVENIWGDGDGQLVRVFNSERPYHIPAEIYFDDDVTQEQKTVIQEALRGVFTEIAVPNNFVLLANRSGYEFFARIQSNPNRPHQVNGDMVMNAIGRDPAQRDTPHHAIVFTNKDLYAGDLRFVVGLAFPDLGTVISLQRIWNGIQDVRLRNATIKTEIAHEVGHVFGLPSGRRGQQNIDYETVPGAGPHCKSPGCSMKQGNAVPQDFVRITQDRLNNLADHYFCGECRQDLQTKFSRT